MYLLFLFTQLIFLVIIFGRFAIFYKKKSNQKTKNHGVSVLICARNEANNLEKFLPLWLSQEYENYEVIVINDRSTDKTSQILTQLSEKFLHLRTFEIQNKPDDFDGKKYAIETGMRLAKNDIILLTDADCYPKNSQNIKTRSAQFDEKTDFVIGYSPYEFEPTLLNLLIQFETLYTAIQYLSFAFFGNPYMAVGRNLGYCQQLFSEKKGFDKYKHLTGGDDDLFVNQYANAGNTKLVINLDSQVVSVPEKNWSDWIRQKKRHLSAGKNYRLSDKIILGILSLSQFGFWISFIVGCFYWENAELMLNFSGFLIRQMCFIFVFWRFIRLLHSELPLKFVFVLEILYILYYLYTGIISLISKKIVWKKENDNFRRKH